MQKLGHYLLVLFAFALLRPFAVDAGESPRVMYYGVNLPQAGFGEQHLPGVDGKDYLWPSAADVNSYADAGANVLRIPFLWERMQPALNGPLSANELDHLDDLVTAAGARHVMVILDIHNAGMYEHQLIGSGGVPATAFYDLWTRLATHYRDKPFVAFGLMNEPYKHQADSWALIAQGAIDAIRKTGAKQLILVPGTRWSGAHSWMWNNGGPSNAEALRDIKDPQNYFVFEAHQYLDSDSSGTHPNCVSKEIGEKRLEGMTDWLRQTGHQAFLGEFGASKDPVCIEAMRRMLRYLNANSDVWVGWTYWAAAAWFGDYMFNVYPPDPTRFPQFAVLSGAMHGLDF